MNWLKRFLKIKSKEEEPVKISNLTKETPAYKQLDVYEDLIPYYRRRKRPVSGIIIHSIAEYVYYIDEFMYCIDYLRAVKLSAHYFTEPNGLIAYCVNPDKCAFHAGESAFQGEKDLNESFIGIEIMVKGKYNYPSFLNRIKEPDAFTDAQYEPTAKLCVQLMKQYPKITVDRILSHHVVSGKDVRPDPKYDVGTGFDMERFYQLIENYNI